MDIRPLFRVRSIAKLTLKEISTRRWRYEQWTATTDGSADVRLSKSQYRLKNKTNASIETITASVSNCSPFLAPLGSIDQLYSLVKLALAFKLSNRDDIKKQTAKQGNHEITSWEMKSHPVKRPCWALGGLTQDPKGQA